MESREAIPARTPLLFFECAMGPVNAAFFFNALSIILIDILLAGDNAVVIAMAVRSLPADQRRKGILAGTGFAVVLRIILTFAASYLLELEFVELIGGILILWIAVRLLLEGSVEEGSGPRAGSLRQAIWMVLVADTTMSLDNILAVAAVARDNLLLLIAGLGLSVSFVVFTSSLLARMMDRYPFLVWIGAAILGKVAGGMVVRDPWILRILHPPEQTVLLGEAAGTVIVVLLGWGFRSRRRQN